MIFRYLNTRLRGPREGTISKRELSLKKCPLRNYGQKERDKLSCEGDEIYRRIAAITHDYAPAHFTPTQRVEECCASDHVVITRVCHRLLRDSRSFSRRICSALCICKRRRYRRTRAIAETAAREKSRFIIFTFPLPRNVERFARPFCREFQDNAAQLRDVYIHSRRLTPIYGVVSHLPRVISRKLTLDRAIALPRSLNNVRICPSFIRLAGY
ncbi:hypothetical protein PUN28_007031 [Cardiocondyla obscurior]|uniref:Uncharacterized protein n=1 Tax=Cardiocondyla obscurior TaxID=286306 RepID=A0AAW2G4L0_9HYME